MVVIRRATSADAEAVLKLTAGFAVSFVVEAAAFRASFEAVITQADTCLFVAEADAAVIGYLLGFEHPTLRANGPVAWVDELAVREAQQRSGVGRALMQAFEGWARERKNALVALATQRAGPFYEAIGYEESAAYYRKFL
jgi:GNAT superfamily N-acetyltransferase